LDQSPTTSGGLTISWGGLQTTRATVSPTSHTNWREVTKFENTKRPKPRQIIAIDF
jgi:hypothetical protein